MVNNGHARITSHEAWQVWILELLRYDSTIPDSRFSIENSVCVDSSVSVWDSLSEIVSILSPLGGGGNCLELSFTCFIVGFWIFSLIFLFRFAHLLRTHLCLKHREENINSRIGFLLLVSVLMTQTEETVRFSFIMATDKHYSLCMPRLINCKGSFTSHFETSCLRIYLRKM